MLTREGCRARTNRLLAWCRQNAVDLAVVSNEKEVFSYSNFLHKPFGWLVTRVCLWGCFSDGTTFLLCSESEAKKAQGVTADHVVTYKDYDIHVTTQTFLDQALVALADALARLGRPVRRVALEERYAPVALKRALERLYPAADFTDMADVILRLRKRKDPDEVELMRRTADLLGMCYKVAGDEIAPGKTDTDIYAACYAAYARRMGEYVTFAGDFLAGDDTFLVTGGPTGRRLEERQTMILDLWIDPYGYWMDNSRTFIVGGKPTREQAELYDLVLAAVRHGESFLRPGVRGQDVYYEICRFFEKAGLAKNLPGHAGHGVGLSPHEAPLFIPRRRRPRRGGRHLLPGAPALRPRSGRGPL